MERSISQRDNVLLGYSSRKSFTSSSNKSVDIDFHDVFGGPPRRSSVHDWRTSLGSNEDEMVLSRDPWSGLTEKPVFGQESNSRKYPSDDFYGDIFRGDESSGSTPRKLSRDPLSSSPASRISSPSRPLPIQSESIRGSSLSLPPILSLPGKLGKEIDSITSPIQSRNARKNKETTLISFPSSPGASTSRFSIQVSQGKEGLEIDSRSSYRQSSLSKEVSLISKGSDEALKFVKHESVAYAKEDSHTKEISYSSTEFHFSIYRWPSTTVPVVAPLRGGNLSYSKESGKTDSITNGHAASNVPDVVLPSENNTTSVKDESLQESQENQDDDSVLSTKSDLTDTSEAVAEVISTKHGQKPRSNFQNIFKKVQDNLMSQNAGNDVKTSTGATGSDSGSLGGFLDKIRSSSKREAPPSDEPLYCLLTEDKIGSGVFGTGNRSVKGTEKRSPISKNVSPSPEEPLYCMLKEIKDDAGASGANKDLLGGTDRRVPISKKEAPNQGEPLYRLLKEDYKRQENRNDTDKVTTKKGTVKSIHTSDSDVGKDKKVKKQTGRRNILNLSKATSPSLEETSVTLDDKPVNNKVKGMVKDFVKIFNQEASSKSLGDVETRVQGNTATDIGAGEVEDQTSVGATKTDQKNNRTLTDNLVKVDQSLKQSAKPQREIKTADQILFQVDQSSKQFAKPKREIKTADQVFEFASERKNSSAPWTETVHGSFVTAFGNVEEACEDLDCTVKELSQDQNNQPQAGQDHEVLQASDAKIRKWSNGKEGNIRSLLSTLQYVLWPESGWKPVPLVDIIEGSSVRRAYQKALLCLHPDKLQQKGAAPHQKYIAEKVFDVLQEAWTQFNSLGSF